MKWSKLIIEYILTICTYNIKMKHINRYTIRWSHEFHLIPNENCNSMQSFDLPENKENRIRVTLALIYIKAIIMFLCNGICKTKLNWGCHTNVLKLSSSQHTNKIIRKRQAMQMLIVWFCTTCTTWPKH